MILAFITKFNFLIIVFFISFSGCLSANPVLKSIATANPPMIDGIANETIWQRAKAVTVTDKILSVPITIKAVHSEKMIYFKVHFADNHEDREHKTLVWDNTEERYIMGGLREDVFIFKWNMENIAVDLSLDSADEYKADIWYWKAMRTDHSGHADDKIQYYTHYKQKKAKKIINKEGKLFYLTRRGDSGKSAYHAQFYDGKIKDKMPRFSFLMPKGSRADIKAKGIWKAGYWTIEFARKLDTGFNDDIKFDLNKSYLFAVSLNELSARKPDPKLTKPYFGSGKISQLIDLHFQP